MYDVDEADDLDAVASALEALIVGDQVVVVDDQGCGAVVTPAATTAAADVNFMVTEARGTIGLALSSQRCDALELELQRASGSQGPTSPRRLTISIDAVIGTTTGISAAERANTIRVAADTDSEPADLVSPGHIFPTRTERAGVFSRRELPEAALDLARSATGGVAATYCVILDDSGEVAGGSELISFARAHGLQVVGIGDVVAFREAREQRLKWGTRERIITAHGTFSQIEFVDPVCGDRHLALVRGESRGRDDVPVSLHAARPIADLVESLDIRGGDGLTAAMRQFARRETGVLVYYNQGRRTSQASLDLASQMIKQLGPRSIRLLDGAEDLATPFRERGVSVRSGPAAAVATPAAA